MVSVPTVFVLCNPLLDRIISASSDFITQFGYNVGGAFLLKGSQTDEVNAKFIKAYPNAIPEFSPGGSGLNTARVIKQLSIESEARYEVKFIGSLADDENGEQLTKICEDIGLETRFQVQPNPPYRTGVCSAFVTERERTLLTHLGAAKYLSESHVSSLSEEMLESSLLYITCYPLSDAPDAAFKAAELSRTVFCNLASAFICSAFTGLVTKLLGYSKLIFGNRDEYTAYLTTLGVECEKLSSSELVTIAQEKTGTQCVMTDGAKTTVANSGNEVVSCEPVPIDKSEIKNSNGAGDAFAGGFIFELLRNTICKGVSLEFPIQPALLASCINAGSSASARVLVTEGTTMCPLKE